MASPLCKQTRALSKRQQASEEGGPAGAATRDPLHARQHGLDERPANIHPKRFRMRAITYTCLAVRCFTAVSQPAAQAFQGHTTP